MTRDDYSELVKLLEPLYPEPGSRDLWMKSQHPQLDGRRPVDCLYSEVKAIINRLESGAYL